MSTVKGGYQLLVQFPRRDGRFAICRRTLARLAEAHEVTEEEIVILALAELRDRVWKFNRFMVRRL